MKQQQQPVMSAASTGAAAAAAATAVPAFLSKLWALVGDAPSNQLITWSQVGVLERGQPRRGAGRTGLFLPTAALEPCFRGLARTAPSGGTKGPAGGGVRGRGRDPA